MLLEIVWKNFQDIFLMTHHPKIVNLNFHFKSSILEIFSRNPPDSRLSFLDAISFELKDLK